MSLVFAAITPHPPMLIPAIGKEKIQNLKQTQDAMRLLEAELYITKPQLIIIISPHSSLFSDSFVINAHTQFSGRFEKFGDLTTKKEWFGSPDFAATLSHEAKKANIPLQSMSEESLDHGATVALYYLTEHLPDVKILPMGFSGLGVDAHVQFGNFLKEVIMRSGKRIAVIASGDLAHCLTQDAPSGYKSKGSEFDSIICDSLTKMDTQKIRSIDQDLTKEVDECGYRSILILLGILQNMQCTFVLHSYEHPFGVGYLVGEFAF